jgi:tetratricopeptide (TPR) repeat protein
LPGWQALRTELHPRGLEVVTVSLELSGPEASRPYVEAARPEHPSLLDPLHRMDALFGVVNIPNVVWIDEDGVIVRPPEPGWPSADRALPAGIAELAPRLSRAPGAPERASGAAGYTAALNSGQDRGRYAAAIRDWVSKGTDSEFALSPAEVVARSQPRPPAVSAAAAHFELADVLWRAGRRDLAINHFTACHRLQPDNWTYRRQAYSLIGHERLGGEFGRFAQGPVRGEEDTWPFDSDFRSEVAVLGEGEYYPRTL